MVSSNFEVLKTRIKELDSNLLPAERSDGAYTPKEQDGVRAFIVLAHAEFEVFMETTIQTNVDKAIDEWKKDRGKITPLIFHMACILGVRKGGGGNPFGLVMQAKADFDEIIKGNNGIKENNLEKMLKPIGFEINTTLQAELTIDSAMNCWHRSGSIFDAVLLKEGLHILRVPLQGSQVG